MSDRYSHRPDSLLIEETAIAALPAPHGPKCRAWVGDARNLSVIRVVNLCELRKCGRQRKNTNIFLLEQNADAVNVTCSEQLPNEVDDEGVYATANILRLDCPNMLAQVKLLTGRGHDEKLEVVTGQNSFGFRAADRNEKCSASGEF